MSELHYYAQAIKEAVSMEDAVRRYLPGTVQRNHTILCPFHNEKTPSLRLYEGGFYCFGCAANGDVIAFVAKLENVRQLDAMKRINDDFGLALPIGRKQTLRELMEQRKFEQTNKRAGKEALARFEEADAEYSAALDEWLRLEMNRQQYQPKSMDEDMHPLFIEALVKGERAAFTLEYAKRRRDELECRVHRHTNSNPQSYMAWTPHSS